MHHVCILGTLEDHVPLADPTHSNNPSIADFWGHHTQHSPVHCDKQSIAHLVPAIKLSNERAGPLCVCVCVCVFVLLRE